MCFLGSDAGGLILATAKTWPVAVALNTDMESAPDEDRWNLQRMLIMPTLTFLIRHLSHAICTLPPLVTFATGRLLASGHSNGCGIGSGTVAPVFGLGTTRNMFVTNFGLKAVQTLGIQY